MRRSLVWLVVKWCLIALDEMNTSCFGWLELRRQNLIVARFICLHLILVIDGKCKLNSSQAWAWCWACGPSISVHTINRSLVPMWHAFILHSYSYNHNCLWTTKQQFSPSWYRSIKKCFFFCFFFFLTVQSSSDWRFFNFCCPCLSVPCVMSLVLCPFLNPSGLLRLNQAGVVSTCLIAVFVHVKNGKRIVVFIV